jgi:hypothetical protein
LNPQASENITDISDALAWIKTYRKAGNFDTALIATKELILKSQTGITYYENAERKIAVLESSNITKIAVAAKEKRKKIDNILIILYKEINELEKIVAQIEKERITKKDIEEKEAQKLGFKLHIQEIKDYLSKKDYSYALSLSKKLVSDFPHESKASEMLTKIQKLYDKEKNKQGKNQEKEEKLKSILKEAGVEINDLKEKKDVSFLKKMTSFIKKIGSKEEERKEYIKRQKALKNIEQLLIQSGTIDNINDGNINSDMLSAMNKGLTKDVSDFSLHGFDFFGKIHGKDKIVGDTFGYHKE